MKFKLIYTLLTLILALCFVSAGAQTQHKKPKRKVVHVRRKIIAAKPKARPKPTAVQQKTNAKNLGEAAATAKWIQAKKRPPPQIPTA
jgi:hypothetical protein